MHRNPSGPTNALFVLQDELKRSGKSSADPSNDIPMIVQNARPPGPYAVPEVLLRYFSVGSDGTPLLTTITPEMVDPPRTDDEDGGGWSGQDYVDMPARRGRQPRYAGYD